ncbi:hypothetical protein CHR53_15455 [Neobacillus mesonae]|uniref:Uncharacterized protein n=1 Tax=Neobacillus mesonae TaxID=1193713 RepID=A0A3T0HZH5_9BACI|nr:hypothetical protein CHR53_15455 [Neobacillus mesonae]
MENSNCIFFKKRIQSKHLDDVGIYAVKEGNFSVAVLIMQGGFEEITAGFITEAFSFSVCCNGYNGYFL